MQAPLRTCITLPYPPSVNGLFANAGKRRIKSAAYKMWLADAEEQLLKQRFNKHTKPCAINIFATKPDNRRRDIDNIAKGILDLLVTKKVLEDDSLVQVLHIEWSTGSIGAYIVIHDLEVCA
jgi:crossover junction endodeoxyribonuclease RusA